MSVDKRFLSLSDLSSLPKPCWMIEDLFEQSSLVMLAGPPGHMKSFLALSWVLSMAAGKKWNNRSTTPAKVLYVLGEGKSNLLKRVQAWITYNHLTPEELARLEANFRVDFDVSQLASKASVDNMLAQLSAEQFTPTVIIIDTFARSAVGLDENSQKDTGVWIESADRLRQLGMTVIFLHHTNKNTEFGYKFRGSSAIEGALDSAFVLHKDPQTGAIKLTCTKQKDHDEGSPLYFKVTQVVDHNGDKEDSIVLTPAVIIDEGFTEDGRKIEEAISKLLADHTFLSDRARARRLKELFPSIPTEAACQNRLVKARAKLKLNDEGDQIH